MNTGFPYKGDQKMPLSYGGSWRSRLVIDAISKQASKKKKKNYELEFQIYRQNKVSQNKSKNIKSMLHNLCQ